LRILRRERAAIGVMKVLMPTSFTVGIDQRTTGVARIDGSVGLDEVAWLARSSE